MSGAVCSVPIAVPVFRMRATLECRDVGSPAHRAAARLRELGLPTDYIAATLGLRTDRTQNLIAQLDGRSGQGVRELRVWIDPAHGAVLTADKGLDIEPQDHQRDIAHLPVLPPRPSELDASAFTDAASSISGRAARIVVDEVRALEADRREGPGAFSHVLHLSRCDLVVMQDATLEVHWHDVVDERLTAYARDALADNLADLPWERLTAVAAEQALSAALGRADVSPQDGFAVAVDPQTIHDRVGALVRSAERQVVLAIDAPLRRLARWVEWCLDTVRTSDGVAIRLVLCDTSRWKGRHARRLAAADAADLPAAVLLACDGDRALIHTSAAAFGAESTLADLCSQAAFQLHDPAAIARLLARLGLTAPQVARRPDADPAEVAITAMRAEVQRQRRYLDGLEVAIADDDVKAFVEHVERTLVDLADRRRIEQIAAGVCWERALHTRCLQLAGEHPQLVVAGLRWMPAGEGMDLDVVLRDLRSHTLWVLDAKHADATGRHVAHMRRQLDIARDHGLVPQGWDDKALIVYPSSKHGFSELTNDRRVRRTTFDRLPDALGLG